MLRGCLALRRQASASCRRHGQRAPIAHRRRLPRLAESGGLANADVEDIFARRHRRGMIRNHRDWPDLMVCRWGRDAPAEPRFHPQSWSVDA
jgi:hypothetical protein